MSTHIVHVHVLGITLLSVCFVGGDDELVAGRDFNLCEVSGSD